MSSLVLHVSLPDKKQLFSALHVNPKKKHCFLCGIANQVGNDRGAGEWDFYGRLHFKAKLVSK